MIVEVVRRSLDLPLGGVVVRDRRQMEGRRGGVGLRRADGGQKGSRGFVEDMRACSQDLDVQGV